VLLQLLQQTPDTWAWLSLCCCDGAHLCDGSRFADSVQICAHEAQVAAVGINCTAPEYITDLVQIARQTTEKPIIVYPNSGEEYDAVNKQWRACAGHHATKQGSLIDIARTWQLHGAVGIGGCCRVGPGQIAELRATLI